MSKEHKRRYIWAIGGGKGGIGKSVIAANLSIALSERGKEVIAVDGDLGGANLHNLFGIIYPPKTLDDFIRKEVTDIRDVLIDTEIPHLKLISGALDIVNMSNPKYMLQQRVIRHIRSLEADYVILDLGAGMSYPVLDFFLISEQGIFVVTPEPTSLENAYRFLRGVFFRKLRKLANQDEVKKIIELAMDRGNPQGIRTPFDLLERVEETDSQTGIFLKEQIRQFRPQLIVNQVRDHKQGQLGFSVQSVCRKYFGIELDYLGFVSYDHNVYLSVQKRSPFIVTYPASEAARCIRDIASHLLDGKRRD